MLSRPTLRAAAMPRRELPSRRTSGKSAAKDSTIARVRSVEASSITMMSKLTAVRSRRRDWIATPMKRSALRAGMITLIDTTTRSFEECSDRRGNLDRILRQFHSKGGQALCNIGKKAETLCRVARKLKNSRWCQSQRRLVTRDPLHFGAAGSRNHGKQQGVHCHSAGQPGCTEFRCVEFNLASPIDLAGVKFRDRNAGAPEPLAILLQHGEHGMRHQGRTIFEEHVIVTDAVQPIQETGKRGAGLPRAARTGDQGAAPVQSEGRGVGEAHPRRGIGPMEE